MKMKTRKRKRLTALVLCLCMMAATLSLPGTVFAAELPGTQDNQQTQEAPQPVKNVQAVEPLADDAASRTIEPGAAVELPTELTGTVDGAESTAIPVTWACEGFDGNAPGEYTFTAKLPEGYVLAAGAALPTITVKVAEKQQAAKTITAANALKEEITRQTAPVGSVQSGLNLPGELVGTVDGKENTPFPVAWECKTFNANVPGEYTFTAVPGEGYTLADNLTLPTVTVAVESAAPPFMLFSATSNYLYEIHNATDWAGLQAWLDGPAQTNARILIHSNEGAIGKIIIPNKNITVEQEIYMTDAVTNVQLVSNQQVVLTIKNLDLSFDPAVYTNGAIDLANGSTLRFEGTNTLSAASADHTAPVINVPANRALTLSGIGDVHVLNLTATTYGAGVGASGNTIGTGGSAGTVSVTGGVITINASQGAGIGGGYGASQGGAGGAVNIYGGVITANATDGAGIGGGGSDSTGGAGGPVNIHGGTVAVNTSNGAGIGGGFGKEQEGGAGGAVSIVGSKVTAKATGFGAGIGGGGSNKVGGVGGDTIAISNLAVVTINGTDGAGIGGGFGGTQGGNGGVAQISGTASVTINMGDDGYGAGIGGGGSGNTGGDGGTTTVTAGNVSITTVASAGIGGGGSNATGGAGGDVTISGGNVTINATNGAGIGGGPGENVGGKGGTVKISGASTVVKIDIVGLSAGIGGGGSNNTGGAGGTATISGGKVTINAINGAGIGGGYGSAVLGGAGGIVNISGTDTEVTITVTNYAAGIGGGGSNANGGAGGNVTITGGKVTINAKDGAGIGGGFGNGPYGAGGTVGTVKISGASTVIDITITGNGAGIGGGGSAGNGGNGGQVSITDAQVTIHTVHGAGIGGGYGTNSSSNGGNGGKVTITNARVTINSSHGAGIGGGLGPSQGGAGGSVTITGTAAVVNITIAANMYGAGIGGGGSFGTGGNGGEVTISGGKVTINGAEGAGIGGGLGAGVRGGDGGQVNISGADTVVAITLQDISYGAGIGGSGSNETGGAGGKVTINGGKVTINVINGAGIGGGYGADASGSGVNAHIGGGGTLTIDSVGSSRTVLDLQKSGTNATLEHSIGTCEIKDNTGTLTGFYSELTVTNATASVTHAQKDFWKKDIFKSGVTVDVAANAPTPNQYFAGWTANPALSFADASKTSTSFPMPETAQTVTANLMQKAAPAITGEQALTVDYGYQATSTSAYTVSGGPAPSVTLDTTHNGKITWNAATGKLDIAAGLGVGTYPVTLTASNGVDPAAELDFTLTVRGTAPAITGETSRRAGYGYAAFSTGAFSVTGNPLPTVQIDNSYGGKITWNGTDNKLDIAAGLGVGTYPVKLTASNGIQPDAILTFTLTVEGEASALTGPASMTLIQGYGAASTGAFTIEGSPLPTVRIDSTHGGKITWNDTDKKLEIAAGLQAGTYPITLTASNGVEEDAALTFTLTVLAPPTHEIIAGGKAEVRPGEDYTVTFAGEFKNWKAVRLNGVEMGIVPQSAALSYLTYPGYTGNAGQGEDGSVKITLNKEFLATLPVGEYKLEVEFEDGGVRTAGMAEFTLVKEAKPANPSDSPATGDTSILWPWVLLTLAALASGGVLAIVRKRGIQKRRG